MLSRLWIVVVLVVMCLVGCSSDKDPSQTSPALTGDPKADCQAACSRGVPACPKYATDQDVQVCVTVCLEMNQGASTECRARFQDWLICVTSAQIVCSENGTGEWEGEAAGCHGFKDWPSPCPCAPISDCEDMAGQIRQVASMDVELTAIQRDNPCADPVPVTSTHDYHTACAVLTKCLCDGCAANCRSLDGG
ncbi:MAG: hypothetical protein WC750_00010 [Patescibacteria group bacterium]|jgi:hypothetical protein